jgi:hypothetical protein
MEYMDNLCKIRVIEFEENTSHSKPKRRWDDNIKIDLLVMGTKCEFDSCSSEQSRSQWPRALRHDLSSPALTLRSLVRIPLEALMSVFIYSVFVLFCV